MIVPRWLITPNVVIGEPPQWVLDETDQPPVGIGVHMNTALEQVRACSYGIPVRDLLIEKNHILGNRFAGEWYLSFVDAVRLAQKFRDAGIARVDVVSSRLGHNPFDGSVFQLYSMLYFSTEEDAVIVKSGALNNL